jgi:streptogramin lyase
MLKQQHLKQQHLKQQRVNQMQVYIRGRSKSYLNSLFADENEVVVYIKYDLEGASGGNARLLPDGTVVKIFQNVVGGNPVAKTYGVIATKNGAKYIK